MLIRTFPHFIEITYRNQISILKRFQKQIELAIKAIIKPTYFCLGKNKR
jgi:hypothetical protein